MHGAGPAIRVSDAYEWRPEPRHLMKVLTLSRRPRARGVYMTRAPVRRLNLRTRRTNEAARASMPIPTFASGTRRRAVYWRARTEGRATANARESRFRGTKRFEVVRRIGAGGAGVVYEAIDREQSTRVALKTLQALNPDALLRFKTEFRALQDLRHPNLVRLGELIEDAGWWFFTMEFVDGVDFLEWVRDDEALGAADDQTISTNATTLRAARVPIGAVAQKRAPAEATGRRLDEANLRAGLAQLSRALMTLHAAGMVHRDLKPSNVLVTREGRVVILDFGLVLDVARGDDASPGHEVVGTVGYMAPEQAAAQAIGPAADWYGVGVILYRALTGRLPFRGAEGDVLDDKRSVAPPPPSSVAPGVPSDLDALCVELLRIDPAARPSGAEVLRRLGERAEGSDDEGASIPPPRTPFVGRALELSRLDAAFRRTLEGDDRSAVVVYVCGESGVGKSALVRQFGERVARSDGALVLHGRCHERESVPFKAVDGVIDALSRYLVHASIDEIAATVPARAALLGAVFPVLRRVPLFAEAAAHRAQTMDPKEQRGHLFGALRELFVRLSARRPIVVAIDDLQWADADSLAMLREVMRPPDAPPILLVATMRDASQAPWEPFEALAIEGLPRDDARALARLLIDASSTERAASQRPLTSRRAPSADAIADEAAGHPFFIDELVRHARDGRSSSAPARGALALDEALWARIARLDRGVRDVLELASVAGAPLAQDDLAHASGVDFGELAARAWVLRVDNLVRVSGARRTDTLETYHDRVRSAVLANLDDATRARWHERIAIALQESGRGDAASLAAHWRGAGSLDRAATYAELAADQAEEALAFDRAASLHRLVLELRGGTPGPRGVHARLGEALVNAGRGAEAADAFLAATSGASAPEVLDLQRRSAEQLLISGHIDRGLDVLRVVLRAVGMKLPGSPRAALASLLLRRAQIRLRGLNFRERHESEIGQVELQRIDICWAAAAALGMVDTIRGADFQTRHLILALDAGEPFRLLRAVTLEAAYSASSGGETRERTATLVAMAEALALRVEHAHAVAWGRGCGGIAAFLEGRWGTALERLDRTSEILRERRAGVTYERDSVLLYTLAALIYLGHVGELQRRLPIAQQEAAARGDIYASTNLGTGMMVYAHLARGDVERARLEADAAIAGWSRDGVHVAHFLDVQGQATIDLYVGEAKKALDRVRAAWKTFDRAMLLRVQYIRVNMLYLWSRAALAAAELAEGEEREALLVEASHKSRLLGREEMPWATGFMHLARAAIAHLRLDDVAACEALDAAARTFEATQMALHLAATHRCWSLVTNDATRSSALLAQARAFEEEERIAEPSRMSALLVAGFGAAARG